MRAIRGHRRAGRRLEGRGLVRAERPPGVSDEHARPDPLDRAASSAGIRTAPRARSPPRAPTHVGLVLARPARTLALEPFFMEFLAGVESSSRRARSPLTYPSIGSLGGASTGAGWWGEHRVDGVLMVDLRVEDPRVDELVRLGLPAVVVGGPRRKSALPAVWHDEGSVLVEAVQYLAALGHRRIAHDRRRRRVRPHRRRGHRRVRARDARRSSSRAQVGRDRLRAPRGSARARRGQTALVRPTSRRRRSSFDSDLLCASTRARRRAADGLRASPARRLDRRLGRLADHRSSIERLRLGDRRAIIARPRGV